ncbi:uncharacterized protein TNCV_315801 [Trichonephila clavipes]|nr:uncharacterized protein TNCV_315801 [Trichonephila clavipes]
MVQVCSSRTENTQFNDFTKHSDDAVSTLTEILPLVSMERKKEYVPLRTAYSQDSRYGMQPKARQSSRAGAAKTRSETLELVEEKQKLLDIRKEEHERSHSFKALDLVFYDWPKQDHKLSPIFKGPFVVVRPVGAMRYEIKSTTQQNKFIKVVHVQDIRPYFKRGTTTVEENSTEEENESH